MENVREIIIRVPKSKAISVVKVLRSRGVILPKGRVPKCDLEAATFKVVGFRGYHKIKANSAVTYQQKKGWRLQIGPTRSTTENLQAK